MKKYFGRILLLCVGVIAGWAISQAFIPSEAQTDAEQTAPTQEQSAPSVQIRQPIPPSDAGLNPPATESFQSERPAEPTEQRRDPATQFSEYVLEHQASSVDALWSREAAYNVRDHFTQFEDDGIQVVSIDCRSRSCLLELEWEEDHGDEWQDIIQQPTPLNCTRSTWFRDPRHAQFLITCD